MKTNIIFLILPQVHILDLAGPDQVFFEALEQGWDISIRYCSLQPMVHTSARLGLTALQPYRSIKPAANDMIVVPGADVTYLSTGVISDEHDLRTWMHNAYNNGAIICSICTGSFFLARMGLLDGKQCTTHWKRTAELKKHYPLVNLVEDILFTADERIYTSAGVTAGIDLALHLVSQAKGERFAFNVARELVIYMRRQGSDQQQSVFTRHRNHIHSGIHRVQDYLQENLEKRTSLDQLATVACMSSRNLTRVFKKETGLTIVEYISLMRKELLQGLLANPEVTRKQMAKLCGLKSERHVIRLINSIKE